MSLEWLRYGRPMRLDNAKAACEAYGDECTAVYISRVDGGGQIHIGGVIHTTVLVIHTTVLVE